MRSRNIKPGFFRNDVLAECGIVARLLFIGLWCYADREGRMEKRVARIKAEIFPYDSLDINGELTVLERNGFIQTYIVDGKEYIQVLNFSEHQHPHHTEVSSKLPSISDGCALTVNPPLNTGKAPADYLIPDSLIPDSNNKTKSISVKKVFKPPTLEEVTEYCKERDKGIDPEYWHDYYQSRGWKIKGGAKMSDWQAAIRTWEKNGFNNKSGAGHDNNRTNQTAKQSDTGKHDPSKIDPPGTFAKGFKTTASWAPRRNDAGGVPHPPAAPPVSGVQPSSC